MALAANDVGQRDNGSCWCCWLKRRRRNGREREVMVMMWCPIVSSSKYYLHEETTVVGTTQQDATTEICELATSKVEDSSAPPSSAPAIDTIITPVINHFVEKLKM